MYIFNYSVVEKKNIVITFEYDLRKKASRVIPRFD